MPLDQSFPAYRAEVTPASITRMSVSLCAAYGVSADHAGAKGNTVHLSGFHRSPRWLRTSPDSRYGSRDYSIQAARNRGGNEDWIAAEDFTPGVWGTRDNREKMKVTTRRMLDAARRYDPRLIDVFEFAGTLDGGSVVTFSGQGGELKDPFDDSHLDHGHTSFWRDGAANDHSGVVEVMLGVAPRKEESDDMGQGNIPLEDKSNIGVPGGANRKPTWLVITNDTAFGEPTGRDYALRIAAKPYGKSWVFIGDTGRTGGQLISSGVVRIKNGETMSWQLPDDTRDVSCLRVPVDAETAVYDGPLSAALEW